MGKRFVLICVAVCLFLSGFSTRSSGQPNKKAGGSEISLPDTLLKNKSPTGALLRSVVFPGGGQFYNGKYLKGVTVFGVETTFLTLAIVEWRRMNIHQRNFQNPEHPDRYREFEQFKFYEDRRNLFLWITAGVVFLSMFDAYVDAHLYNFDKEKVRDLSLSLISGTNDGDGARIAFFIRF